MLYLIQDNFFYNISRRLFYETKIIIKGTFSYGLFEIIKTILTSFNVIICSIYIFRLLS